MIRSKPVTAVIPVRGGSKGIPGKNLRRIGGWTLLERTIRFALASPRIDRVLVTTDNPAMYEIAGNYGVAAPSMRPDRLATDTATTFDAVRHLIDDARIGDDYILVLQVTTPLRTLADLDALVERFERDGRFEAAVSVTPHEGAHPEKLQRLADGCVVSCLGVEAGRARQTMPDLFELNGAFYLIDRDTLLREQTFLPRHTMAFVMPPERSANLDTMTDWLVLDAMLASGHWTFEEYD